MRVSHESWGGGVWQAVEAASAANIGSSAPVMVKARSLLGLMESAMQTTPERKADPLDAKMDAIFGGGYAMPGLEDLDEVNS